MKKQHFLIINIIFAIASLLFIVPLSHAGPGGGTYYANSPAGGDTGTAMAKFVDGLPGLGFPGCTTSLPCGTGSCNENNLCQYIPVAQPDQTTYPGDDYYILGIKDYRQKMHSNLPDTTDALGTGTRLRGYYQINGVDHSAQYLGPLIMAHRDVPVRIRFENHLGLTGAGGDLFIPVDSTVMGAGMGPFDINGDFCEMTMLPCESFPENRAELHLHGGFTPWVSDGTPHQWTTPAGETTPYPVGISMQNVPDMLPIADAAAIDPPNGLNQVIADVIADTDTFLSNLNNLYDPPELPPPGPPPNPNLTLSEQQAVDDIQTARDALAALPAATVNNYRDQLYALYSLNTIVSRTRFPSVTATSLTTGATPFMPADVTAYKVDQLANKINTITIAINGTGVTQGIQTYYYPNQQSARFMFYHDHSYAITRLNVYAGEAAGYLLDDPAEQALVGPSSAIPDTQLPLIIQDKSFVPQNIDVQDSLWTDPNWGIYGDLWFPHVYEPNQDPSQPDGMNPTGRWDYGPWIWPPFPVAHDTLPEPSIVPEAFLDTQVVNGTAYPYANVDRKRYRLRILNASNDRTLNLQLYYAEPLTVSVLSGGSNYSDNPTITFSGGGATTPATAAAVVTDGAITSIIVTDPGEGYTSAPTVSIADPTGSGAVAIASIKTEIAMVPAPDSRPEGVPDETMAGPRFLVIGTEGGLLPVPYITNDGSNAAVKPLYITYDNDPKSMTVGNILNTNLLVGPAQRIDMIIDFKEATPGSTLILYNDAPAAAPAPDKRYDYYTGNEDMTPMGGAPTTLPGFGPNTRTVMQFRVSSAPAASDPTLDATKTMLDAALPTYFAANQPPLLVNPGVYADNFSKTLQDANDNILPIHMKAIIEEFEMEYGRMTAMLGTEQQFTGAMNQTSLWMNFPDLPSEVMPSGQPQIWMIIHNGVDTHFIHFHLFNVQVINRVDWAGVIKPPYDDEIGWRETIRMDPLEQTIVAVQAAPPDMSTAPWAPTPLPDSVRPNDVTMMPTGEVGSPYCGPKSAGCVGSNANPLTNFGSEYIWHCHLLGHEENDMMRPLIVEVPNDVPTAPSDVTTSDGCAPPATCLAGSRIKVQWTNASQTWPNDANTWPNDPIGFRVERCVWDPIGVACVSPFTPIAHVIPFRPLPDVFNPTLDPVVDPTLVPLLEAYNTPSYIDSLISPDTEYNYQVIAYNAMGDALPVMAATSFLSSTWGTATSVALSANAPSPHNAGTAVLFTADAVGCTNCQYRFTVNGSVVKDFGYSSTYSLPATTLPGLYTVMVEVRTYPTDPGPYTVSDTIADYRIRYAPATSVTLVSDQPSPHVAGSAVMFSAAGQGSSNYEYRFLLDGVEMQPYSPFATWTMPALTPVVPTPHVVRVEVRTDASVALDAFASVEYEVAPGFTFIANANGSLTGTLVQALNLGIVGTAVTAVPATGYHLVNWTGTNGFVTTTDNPLTVTGDGAGHTVIANFAINSYTVNFLAGANGSLVGTTMQDIDYGDSTTAVEAVPDALYHFVNWTGTGGFRSVSNPLTIADVTSNMDITANFDVGTTMVPDGDLGYGVTVEDAMTALMIAAGSIPVNPGYLAHGDVAPLVNGRPQPDGKIDIGDAVVILRKALGMINWQ